MKSPYYLINISYYYQTRAELHYRLSASENCLQNERWFVSDRMLLTAGSRTLQICVWTPGRPPSHLPGWQKARTSPLKWGPQVLLPWDTCFKTGFQDRPLSTQICLRAQTLEKLEMFLTCSKAHITTWERTQIPLNEWGQCLGSKKQ